MKTVTAEEIIRELRLLEDEIFIEPRRKIAKLIGFSGEEIKSVNRNTVFIIAGRARTGLPNYVRFSPLLEKGTGVMMSDPTTF